jgi:hypothetical protein
VAASFSSGYAHENGGTSLFRTATLDFPRWPKAFQHGYFQSASQMLDNASVESFVIDNSAYYRAKWQRFHDTPGAISSFNAAACLGQIFWLAYRKLYMPLLWLVGVSFAAGVANALLVLDHQDYQSNNANLISGLNLSLGVLLYVVPGFLGNYWYWRRFRRVEQQAAAKHPDRDAQLRFIRSKGGTNPIGAVLLIVLLLMPVGWALYQATRIDISGFVLDSKGPLTLAEVRANFIDHMEGPLEGARRDCVFREVEERTRAAGDPETLDPTTVEFLPAERWNDLEPFGRRILLAQVIVTKALFVCESQTIR